MLRKQKIAIWVCFRINKVEIVTDNRMPIKKWTIVFPRSERSDNAKSLVYLKGRKIKYAVRDVKKKYPQLFD